MSNGFGIRWSGLGDSLTEGDVLVFLLVVAEALDLFENLSVLGGEKVLELLCCR
jgi:hypothetical protein